MTLIVGVDPSTKHIACVAIETITQTYAVEKQMLGKKKADKQTPESLLRAMEAMRHFCERVGPMGLPGEKFAYVELPLVGRGGVTTTMKQAYVGGIIRACLVEAGFTVYDANVSTWRAGLGLGSKKGTAAIKQGTSQYVGAKAPKLHRLVTGDDDLTDAAAIALYGSEQVRKADLLGNARSSAGKVQGEGLSVVVRPSRVRPGVRQR